MAPADLFRRYKQNVQGLGMPDHLPAEQPAGSDLIKLARLAP